MSCTRVAVFLCCCLSCLAFLANAQPSDCYLFIGTNTTGKSEGIYVYRFAEGKARQVSKARADNPSYLAVSKNGDFVYAVKETGVPGNSGASAFGFDKQSGNLTYLNTVTVATDGPCYLTVDPARKWLFTAEYKGGGLSAIPIRPDGSLGPLVQSFRYTGNGPVTKRQEAAHAHTAVFSPDHQHLFVTDLGTDLIHRYRFDPASTSLPLQVPTDSVFRSKPGNGPRHLAFTQNGKRLYAINELGGTIDLFDVAVKNGPLVATVPSDSVAKPTMACADIHLSPDGRFLYATNRGVHNNIAVFSLDKHTGVPHWIQTLPTGGNTPRNFAIDPSGRYLLVANQRSDNVHVFARDPVSGKLSATQDSIAVPSPACLQFSSAVK